MSAPLYSTRGPHTAQDGRQVYTVVRLLEAPPGVTPAALAVAECLSQRMAQEHADALNHAAERAAALTLT